MEAEPHLGGLEDLVAHKLRRGFLFCVVESMADL